MKEKSEVQNNIKISEDAVTICKKKKKRKSVESRSLGAELDRVESNSCP